MDETAAHEPQEQLDAAEQVVKAVREADGTSLGPVADQLGRDWPELAYALARLCDEFGMSTSPRTWRESPGLDL